MLAEPVARVRFHRDEVRAALITIWLSGVPGSSYLTGELEEEVHQTLESTFTHTGDDRHVPRPRLEEDDWPDPDFDPAEEAALATPAALAGKAEEFWPTNLAVYQLRKLQALDAAFAARIAGRWVEELLAEFVRPEGREPGEGAS